MARIGDATRRVGVIWVQLPGDRPRPLWHLWHNGAAYVVTGGLEQPLPGAPRQHRAQVVTPGRATSDQPLTWVARLEPVPPGTAGWDEVAPLLRAKRLNAPDGEAQQERWARESVLLRLVPTGEVVPPTDDRQLARPPSAARS